MKVILLLVSLLLLAPPVAAQVADDNLIVPGQGIGKWTLAMSVDDIVKMNGGPSAIRAILDENKDNADLRLPNVRAYCFGSLHVSSQDAKRADYLFVDGGPFKTERGLGVFSLRKAVEATYGKPTAISKTASGSSEAARLIYDKNGIAFKVDSYGTVTRIVIFRPGTASTIWKF